MLLAESLFDTTTFSHHVLFSDTEPVWSALHDLKHYMDSFTYQTKLLAAIADGTPLKQSLVLHDNRLIPASACKIVFGDTCKGNLSISKDSTMLEGATLIMAGAVLLGSRIVIGRASLIEGGATIKAPTIIGHQSEIRQGAYMRGYCLIGDRCVVGHTTEVKHSIFMNDAKAGHFAYLGDSILGNNSNLGAGTKFANLKFIPGNVRVLYNGKYIDTGMRKFGAILGDNAQTGCNSVTSPGTILGKKGVLMPNTTAPSGYHQNRHRIR